MQTTHLFFIRSHSSLLAALALVFVASASSGCSTEPCPDGTKQDGDVCRRIPTMKSNPNQTAGMGANADDDLSGDDVDNPKAGKGGAGGRTSTASAGRGGSAGSDEEADSENDEEENTAGKAGSSGKGGSGGMGDKGGAGGSKAGVGGGGAGGMKAAGAGGSAGKGGAGGAAGKAGMGGMGGAGMAAAGSGAGNGGSSGAAGKAGMGGMGGAGTGGAGGMKATTEIPEKLRNPDGWFCVNIGRTCACVDGKGDDSDSCISPKPTCCYVVVTEQEANCQCSPENSEECKEANTSQDAVKVDACPLK
jgi:hypothetical protein